MKWGHTVHVTAAAALRLKASRTCQRGPSSFLQVEMCMRVPVSELVPFSGKQEKARPKNVPDIETAVRGQAWAMWYPAEYRFTE